MTVKTRFAPSPTGFLHIGGVRTALFSWLHARHHGGRFVLRIEDTDRERSTQAAVDAILEGMAWLGLDHDEGPFFQMRRLARYREQAERLLADGRAYRCWCSREELEAMRAAQVARGENPRYDGRCRGRSTGPPGIDPVVRFAMPRDGRTVVDDRVRGRVEVDNAELDDFVLLRADGIPTFHFGVVVDDGDMGITHVIRGDDHLNNTPRHLHLIDALGYPRPVFAHLPMILGPDGAKLSKRHGAVNVLEYRDQGFLPDALLNHLVRLGWAHGDQEVFGRDEMIRLFDLAQVNASAARFDVAKLTWLNQQHIRDGDRAAAIAALRWQFADLGIDEQAGPDAAKVVDAWCERSVNLREMAQSCAWLYRDALERDAAAARKHLTPAIVPALEDLLSRLRRCPQWQREALHVAVADAASAAGIGFGKLGQPLRVALCGGTVSPPIDVTLVLVGRERSVERLVQAIALARGES